MFKKLIKTKFILFTLALMLMVAYIVTMAMLPGNITLLKGERYTLSFKSPFSIKVHTNSNILQVSDSSEKSLIDMDNPYSLTATEVGRAELGLSLFGVIPVKTVVVKSIESQKLVASGAPIGIKLKTDGIVIINISGVILEDGTRVSPAEESGLLVGDSLIEANGKKLNSISDLTATIQESQGNPVDITYRRQNHEYKTRITPIKSGEDHQFRAGMWVRDSSAGIGTLTFIRPDNKVYGALGHGINDVDTGSLLIVGSGTLLESNIDGIKKGQKGSPGELEGDFLNNPKELGDIELNCDFGIFGKVNSTVKPEKFGRLMDIASHSTVQVGKASILACINGQKVDEYEIEIQRIVKHDLNSTKNMIIRITDKRLLNATGGIVQGMSGSPIIQNGKLVGAVTHVFINDPMRGYGVFIESMLEQTKNVENRGRVIGEFDISRVYFLTNR